LAGDLGDTIARLRAAWMAGGMARKHCPPEWLPTIGDGPPAELALAALAGQALHAVFRPAPGGPLVTRDPLPPLAHPPVPDALRPRVRRLVAAYPSMVKHLLALLAGRGFTVHPADWLPTQRSDPPPALYAPWLLWVNGGAAPPRSPAKPLVADPALAAELAQLLEVVSIGIVHRRKRLKIAKLKTAPQTARRLDLFAKVTLGALAAALGTTSAELVATAPTGVPPGIAAFAAMVAATGTPDEHRRLLAAMLDDPECPLAGTSPLAATLDRAEAAALLPTTLRRETTHRLTATLNLAGAACGLACLPDIEASPSYKLIRERLAAAALSSPGQEAHIVLALCLTELGLVAHAQAAQSLLEMCIEAGLPPADRRLDALHLNIALTPEISA